MEVFGYKNELRHSDNQINIKSSRTKNCYSAKKKKQKVEGEMDRSRGKKPEGGRFREERNGRG